MSSGKKKKKNISARNVTAKGAAVNKAAAKSGSIAGVGKNALWLLPAAAFLISLCSSSLMKYPVGFGIAFGFVNGFIAFFGAQMLSGGDGIPWGHRLFEKKWGLVAISAALPAVSLLLMFAAQGMQPFGDVTVMAGDMVEQYVPFVIARNRTLLSGGSMLYSDSFGLGGSDLAAMMYYTASPFMLIFMPFGKSSMPELMCLVQILKTAAAGGAFGYFYIEKFHRRNISVCVFSLMYALMTYLVGNLINIIWLDCIILLPLIILGLERLAEGKSPTLYIVCLALAIFTNYYIAYMICIYLVLYYVLYNFLRDERLDMRSHLKIFVKFALSSILSAGMAGICLLPSAAAISQTAGNGDTFAKLPLLNYSPVMLIGKLFWGSDISFKNSTLPNVYCSMFAVLMLAYFIICKGIGFKKKAAYLTLLGFLTVCTFFKYTDIVWHGFHVPIGLPYRYSFLISFTLIITAAEAWEHIHELSFEKIMYSVVAFTVLILANFLLDGNNNVTVFAVSAVLVFMAVVLTLLVSSKRIGMNVFAAFAALLVFADLTLAGTDVFTKLVTWGNYWKNSEYDTMLKVNDRAVEQIRISDSDIYRIEDENGFAANQGLYYDSGSLTCYATPNNGNAVNLMDALGYAGDEINKYVFNLYTPFSDSVLNLKYIMSGDSSQRKYLTLTDIDGYGKNVYRNDLVLPRAFAVSGNIEEWSIENDDPFEVQNSLGRLASGEDADVYELLKRQDVQGDDGSFVITNGCYSAVYDIPYDGDLFCYFKSRECERISVKIGERSYSLKGDISCIFPLYEVKRGDVLRIDFYGEDVSGYVSAAMQNDEALLRTLDKMSQHPVNFEKYADGLAEGSVTVEEECILFTSIPYENGWSAELDGKSADIVKIGGCLIGIRLHEGENHIKLSYSSTAFVLGLWSTLISLAIFAAMILKTETHFIHKISEKINKKQ